MTILTIALMFISGTCFGFALRGLTIERALRRQFIADLKRLQAASEAREAGLADALRAVEELRRVLRVPR